MKVFTGPKRAASVPQPEPVKLQAARTVAGMMPGDKGWDYTSAAKLASGHGDRRALSLGSGGFHIGRARGCE